MKKTDKIKPLTSDEYEVLEKNIYGILAQNLRKARTKTSNNYTQQDIADYLNTTNARISKIERAKENPSFASIKMIADFLGVSLDWLCKKNEANSTEEAIPTPWVDIPPIQALLIALNHFEPTVEFYENNNKPCIKLTFSGNGFPPYMEHLKPFFKQYQNIINLTNDGPVTIILDTDEWKAQ